MSGTLPLLALDPNYLGFSMAAITALEAFEELIPAM